MNREDYFRCKYCGELFEDFVLREIAAQEGKEEEIGKNGFRCPNGCKESFNQPPYESPLQS